MAKRFKFKLESLKKARNNKVLAAKKDLAIVLNKINQIESNLKKVNEESRESIDGANNLTQNSGLALLMGTTLLRGQIHKKAALLEELKIAEADLKKHQEWVTHLSKELKAVEKLEEKQQQQHNELQKLREKKTLEAWVVEQWSYKKESGAGV